MGGDFNCVVNQNVDKYPFKGRAQMLKSKFLCNMMKELGLIDKWRLKHPSRRDYNFFFF